MTPGIDRGEQALASLRAGWYNALVAGLDLDPLRFQILQPSPWIDDSSLGLWRPLDQIPPAALVVHSSGAGGQRFYEGYAAVISQLVSRAGSSVKTVLAEAYGPWLAYAAALPNSADVVRAFEHWAKLNCPERATRGARAITAAELDPIYRAQVALLRSAGATFRSTIDDLSAALGQAAAGSVAYDSATANADTADTWAPGEVGDRSDVFSASADFDRGALGAKLAGSHVTVSATFSRVTTFRAGPGPWYSPGAFRTAYERADDTVWAPGTGPTWESTFGPAGTMQRFAESLVVVDGLSTVVTSDASFSPTEQTAIAAQADGGLWSCFSVPAGGGQETTVTFGDGGGMTTTSTSPPGDPAILGVNVMTAAEFLGDS